MRIAQENYIFAGRFIHAGVDELPDHPLFHPKGKDLEVVVAEVEPAEKGAKGNKKPTKQ